MYYENGCPADPGTGKVSDFSERKCVFFPYQFYKNGSTGPETSDSEQASLNIGGTGQCGCFSGETFQLCGAGAYSRAAEGNKSPHIRYCGTPLKYSLSEEKQERVHHAMVALGEKGTAPLIQTLPLHPMRDVRRIKGTLEEVLKKAEEEGSG